MSLLKHKSKIAQVITNLLTNAINYSYEDGDINVRVYRDDFRVIFEVQDFGIGIKCRRPTTYF